MSIKLRRRWGNFQAGDLVYCPYGRKLLARVANYGGYVFAGRVPVIFLFRPERRLGVMQFPADDLERLVIPPFG